MLTNAVMNKEHINGCPDKLYISDDYFILIEILCSVLNDYY